MKKILLFCLFLAGCQTSPINNVGPLFTDKDIKATKVDPALFVECQPTLSTLDVEEPTFNDLAALIGKHVKEYSDCVSKDSIKTNFIREAFPQKTEVSPQQKNNNTANLVKRLRTY